MIVKLCTMSLVLVAFAYAYPADEAPQADLVVVAKEGPIANEGGGDILRETDQVDLPAGTSADEDESLKGAESGWGGWGWGGGYGHGRGYGGWGGYGGYGHGLGGYGGWGRGYGGGWGGHGGGWGKRYYKYWG